jgi:MoaD family protein
LTLVQQQPPTISKAAVARSHSADSSTFTVFYQRKVMAIKVLIPTPLQKFTQDQAEIECDGNTIDAMIDSLETTCPGIKSRICDEEGKLRRFLNIYVNSEDIRFLDGQNTGLKDGDEVSIVPAVAGG